MITKRQIRQSQGMKHSGVGGGGREANILTMKQSELLR